MSLMTIDASIVPPRILIVSRRTIRKNKFVDFVGEYHLDLIVRYGAVPVIVPRVSGVHMLLESFGPIHGVLLCEGEDINPKFYEEPDSSDLSPEELEEIKQSHASEITFDNDKDLIELGLAKLCIERNIPYLGICRGSQLLNVACGGTLYQDIEMELTNKCPEEKRVTHMNYDNYDGHRHVIKVVEKTPLQQWFKDELGDNMEIMVNSYHHQGVKKLAQRFVPMAFAPDGLIEGFYDPDAYNPEEGKFIMGLQFHPERMRKPDSEEFVYPVCPAVYREFVKATIAYQKRLMSINNNLTEEKLAPLKLNNQEMEMHTTKIIFKSFSLVKNIQSLHSNLKDSELIISPQDAELLESKTTLSQQQEINRLKLLHEEREQMARTVIGKMSVEQLSHLLSFYRMMGRICSEVVERKLQVSNCL